MRDVILTALVAGLVPVALLRPYAGLLVFTWLAVFRPQEMCWSFAREAPFSLVIGIALLAGLVLGRVVGRPFAREARFIRPEPPVAFMILFWAATGFSALFGIDPAGSRESWATLSKIVLVALLGSGLLGTRERVRGLIVVIGLSLGALALKCALFSLRTGEPRIHHGPGGMMADSNDFGLALVMGLALLLVPLRDDRSRTAKAVAGVLGAACVATVFLTHSRSGFVALLVVAVGALLAMRRRAIALVVAPAVLVGLVLLAPEGTVVRLTNVWSGTPDASASARLVAFRKAVNVAAEEPLFGVGPGNFVRRWAAVPPVTEAAPIVVHNTYLQVLAESGAVGLALFLAMLGSAAVGLLRVIRGGGWRGTCGTGVLLALAGFAAGAMFLSRVNFDLVYVLVGVVPAIEFAKEAGAPAAVSLRPRLGLPWRAAVRSGEA